MPDLDDGIANRIAFEVEDAAAQVRDLADGRRDGAVDDEQVVVRVERHLVGVERPLGLGGCAGEFLGEQARRGEGGGPQGAGAQEQTTRRQNQSLAHDIGSLVAKIRTASTSSVPNHTASSRNPL
jgi:hypothetical protein